MKQYSTQRDRSTAAMVAIAGAVSAGVVVAMQLRRRAQAAAVSSAARGVHVHEAITINRPLAEVYRYWRNFENFPSFMSHLDSVQSLGAERSLWRARGAAGLRIEWEAELIGEVENEWLAWRSIDGSDVQHSGSVRFEHAPGARGTEVHVELQYNPPAGMLGHTIARLFGRNPEQQIREDLRRFKQILEAGEIPVSDGPGLWRAAQPPERIADVKERMGVQR